MLVLVPKMILAELGRNIALLVEQIGNRRRPVGNSLRRTRHADGKQARPERVLSENERGASGCAALLGISIREERAFLSYAVNVGRVITHQTQVISTDVRVANVIPPDDENVRFLACYARVRRRRVSGEQPRSRKSKYERSQTNKRHLVMSFHKYLLPRAERLITEAL